MKFCVKNLYNIKKQDIYKQSAQIIWSSSKGICRVEEGSNNNEAGNGTMLQVDTTIKHNKV